MTFKKFAVLFYLVPFVALLCGNLNFLIGYAFVISPKNFLIFLILNLLFIASISLVVGNILIEASLNLFTKTQNCGNLALLYKNEIFPIKPLIFVVVFSALYIYLAIDLTNLNLFKFIIMLIPSASLIINSKYFLSKKVRFIEGKYVLLNPKYTEIFSFNINSDDEIVFVTSSADEINTGVRQTDIDFKKFKEECEKNGLKSMIKKA